MKEESKNKAKNKTLNKLTDTPKKYRREFFFYYFSLFNGVGLFLDKEKQHKRNELRKIKKRKRED